MLMLFWTLESQNSALGLSFPGSVLLLPEMSVPRGALCTPCAHPQSPASTVLNAVLNNGISPTWFSLFIYFFRR